MFNQYVNVVRCKLLKSMSIFICIRYTSNECESMSNYSKQIDNFTKESVVLQPISPISSVTIHLRGHLQIESICLMSE